MALNPMSDGTDRIVVSESTPVPSKTYRFDFDTNEIYNEFIDEDDALLQFVEKAVLTARFRFPIYDDQYGSEIDDLIGQDVTNEFLNSEIPRVITEALVYDDRISDVNTFVITRTSDQVYVSFTVVKTDGTTISTGVNINGNV